MVRSQRSLMSGSWQTSPSPVISHEGCNGIEYRRHQTVERAIQHLGDDHDQRPSRGTCSRRHHLLRGGRCRPRQRRSLLRPGDGRTQAIRSRAASSGRQLWHAIGSHRGRCTGCHPDDRSRQRSTGRPPVARSERGSASASSTCRSTAGARPSSGEVSGSISPCPTMPVGSWLRRPMGPSRSAILVEGSRPLPVLTGWSL